MMGLTKETDKKKIKEIKQTKQENDNHNIM
jgi:hypothetical protein